MSTGRWILRAPPARDGGVAGSSDALSGGARRSRGMEGVTGDVGWTGSPAAWDTGAPAALDERGRRPSWMDRLAGRAMDGKAGGGAGKAGVGRGFGGRRRRCVLGRETVRGASVVPLIFSHSYLTRCVLGRWHRWTTRSEERWRPEEGENYSSLHHNIFLNFFKT
jgi:hypothetical protein